MERKNYNKRPLPRVPKKTEGGSGNPEITARIRALTIALLSGALISLVLLLVGAAIAYSSADPGAIEKPLSFAALFIGIAVGGFVLAAMSPDYRFPLVLLLSSVFALILFLSRLSFKSMGSVSLDNSFYSYLGIPASALLGLLTYGISRKQKRPSAKKKISKLGKRKK